MSALFVVSNSNHAARATTCARLEASLSGQGFSGQKWFHWKRGSLCWYGAGEGGRSQATWVDMDVGFIAQVGTLFYDGHGGEEALRRLWRDFRNPRSIVSDRLFGSFLVALAKEGELWLLNDRVGMIRLYTIPALGAMCTSWLACADTIDSLQLDEFGAQEYILLGANHGDRTPVAGIGISDPSLALELIGHRSVAVTTLDDWIGNEAPTTLEAAVETCAEILHDRISVVGRALDNKVRSALSGGFDSRLLVAASLSAGIRPDLFVYGAAGDEDVRVAKAAAAAVDLPLRHVDKSLHTAAPPPADLVELRAILAFFDGIPPDGLEISGIDRLTRIAQSADGHVALNGGGGEIMRNFFYLPDGRFTAGQIEQVFYRPYVTAVFNSREQCEAFRFGMETSIARLVGPGRLDRQIVELIYPLFRNRYWAGRNNSLAARLGDFLTPLLDPALIILCARLPLAWKNDGLLQSHCIARLSPPLGRVPLGYGFAPLDGPGRRLRLKAWLERHRPVLLRGYSASLKQLLSRRGNRTMPPLARLLPGEWAVARTLRTERLSQADQLIRALTLESLIRTPLRQRPISDQASEMRTDGQSNPA